MSPELNIYRIIGAIAAVLAAVNTFLIAQPDGTIPQVVMIIMGGFTVAFAALNAFLAGPLQMARLVVNKMKPQLKVAQREESAK